MEFFPYPVKQNAEEYRVVRNCLVKDSAGKTINQLQEGVIVQVEKNSRQRFARKSIMTEDIWEVHVVDPVDGYVKMQTFRGQTILQQNLSNKIQEANEPYVDNLEADSSTEETDEEVQRAASFGLASLHFTNDFFDSKKQAADVLNTLENEPALGQCSICLDDILPEDFITSSCCSTMFHLSCLRNYVGHQLNDGIFPLKCVNIQCKTELEEDFVFSCCLEEDKSKFQTLQHALEENERVIAEAPEKSEDEVDEWIVNNCAQCYRCGVWIERRVGCPKITCRCGAKFCYTCRKPRTTGCDCNPGHGYYSIFNTLNEFARLYPTWTVQRDDKRITDEQLFVFQ